MPSIFIMEIIMDSETKKLLKVMEKSNKYVSVADLVKRFAEIDEIYGQTPWNLDQIIRNINMTASSELPKKEPTVQYTPLGIFQVPDAEWKRGWNACIDKFLDGFKHGDK